MEKISIAISQNDEGLFNLVVNRQTTTDGVVQNDPIIKSDISLEDVKTIINSL